MLSVRNVVMLCYRVLDEYDNGLWEALVDDGHLYCAGHLRGSES